MSSERITVVDIGSTKTACIVAERGEAGGLRVVAATSTPGKGMRRGSVADLDEAARSVDVAVREAERLAGAEQERVSVGIGGPHVEGTTTRGYVPIYPKSRQISREDVLQVIKHSRQVSLPPDREQIQAMPQDFSVDGLGSIQRPIGMSGGRLEVNTFLVTVQAAHVQNIERAVTMTGHKVEQMVLQSLASGLGVLSADELEMGCAVIDIGGGTTDVAVFENGAIVFQASLPVGAQLVTSDLSKLLKTTSEEAERLKCAFGTALPDTVAENETVDVLQLGHTDPRPLARRVLCEIIQSRTREIATMAAQQLQKSRLLGSLPGGVVITGGGSQLPGTPELFESVLQNTKVRIGRPSDAGIRMKGMDGPEWAAGAGLARFALQNLDDDFSPVGGSEDWKDRIRTFWSLLSGRA